MEAAKVNQRVGGQEEVADNRGDGIQLANQTAAEGDEEGEEVASLRLIVRPESFAEILNSGEQLIRAEGLEDLGRGDQAGKSRGQRGSVDSSVDERAKPAHHLNHLKVVHTAVVALSALTEVAPGNLAHQLRCDVSRLVGDQLHNSVRISHHIRVNHKEEADVGDGGDDDGEHRSFGDCRAGVLQIAADVGAGEDARGGGEVDAEDGYEVHAVAVVGHHVLLDEGG